MKELIDSYKAYVYRAYEKHVASFMQKYRYTNIELFKDQHRESLVFLGDDVKPYASGYPWTNSAPHDDYGVACTGIKQDYLAALKVMGLSQQDDLWIHTDFVLMIVKAKHGDDLSIHVVQE